jgi:ATP-binding cassette subfamily B protein
MARQGAYWRLYEAQARRADGSDMADAGPASGAHSAHPAGQP